MCRIVQDSSANAVLLLQVNLTTLIFRNKGFIFFCLFHFFKDFVSNEIQYW